MPMHYANDAVIEEEEKGESDIEDFERATGVDNPHAMDLGSRNSSDRSLHDINELNMDISRVS